MSWLERLCLAVLLSVIAFLVAGPANADDDIARRLAALRFLVDPDAAPALDAPPEPPSGLTCPTSRAWGRTAYGVRARTGTAIRDASLRFGVDSDLIRSVIRTESAYDIHAISNKGAMGLMQLMPATARSLGVVCPYDPRENVLGGTRYLRALYDRLGTWPRALAGYHAGPSRAESGRLPGITRWYVDRVMADWKGVEGSWASRL